MSASVAAKKSTVLSDAVLEQAAPKKKVAEKATSKVNEQITANPFYKVALNPELNLEQRRAEVAKLMTSTMNREQDRANVAAYEDFREWLTAQNTELAKQTIALTNVSTMSELQSVIKDMNTDLISFNDQMSPIMEIIDSIYQLRTNGRVGDAFREIKEDEERQKKIDEDIAKLYLEIDKANAEIDRAKEKKIQASTKKSFFGFGGLTAEAQATITRADMDITERKEEIAKRRSEIDSLKASAPNASTLGELAIHKERLKQLLDLSADENRNRVVGLRDAAAKFIETAEVRTGSLREQFVDYKGQIERVVDNNSGMKKVYLVLNEGLSDAEKANSAKRSELTEKEGETALERSTREEIMRNLDNHITMVKSSQGETLATAADLEQQAVRVNTMQQSAQQQIDTARSLNTQGVSATADRLAVVLSAISGAALGEASAVAEDTLRQMRDSTNGVAQREVIRVAMGTDRMNSQLQQITEELADLSAIQRTASGITRNSMSEMQEKMAVLAEQASNIRDAMREHGAIAAEIDGDAASAAASAPAKSAGSNFFGNL